MSDLILPPPGEFGASDSWTVPDPCGTPCCPGCDCNPNGLELIALLFDEQLIDCTPAPANAFYDLASYTLTPDPNKKYFLTSSIENPLSGALVADGLTLNGSTDPDHPTKFVLSNASSSRYGCLETACPKYAGKNIQKRCPTNVCADVTKLLINGENIFRCWVGTGHFKAHSRICLWSAPIDFKLDAICDCCGPCCLPDGSCANIPGTQCAARFGVRHHEKSNCGGDETSPSVVVDCGVPCCKDSHCDFMPEADCIDAGGTVMSGTCCESNCGGCGCSQPPPNVIFFNPTGFFKCVPHCTNFTGSFASRRASFTGVGSGLGNTFESPCDYYATLGSIFVEDFNAYDCEGTGGNATYLVEMFLTIAGGKYYWSIDVAGANVASGVAATACNDCYNAGGVSCTPESPDCGESAYLWAYVSCGNIEFYSYPP